MEAVGLGEAEGVVQPVQRVATAPYHTKAKPPGENTGVDRLPVSATFRAPDLPSLFGSQVDVPVLAAPTAVPPARQVTTVNLPRRALAALAAMVFVCGIVIGALARRPAAPVAVAPAAPAVAPAPKAAAPQVPPVDEAAGPDFAPPIITVPAPVKILATKKVAAHRAAPAPKVEVEPAPAKPWVDPFAD
jgi:hypothetical protein